MLTEIGVLLGGEGPRDVRSDRTGEMTVQEVDDGTPGILVPERLIRAPQTVSPQAQAILARPPLFDPEPAPDVADKAGWRAYIARQDAVLAGFMQRKLVTHPAKIVTHHLSAAPLYALTPDSLSATNDGCAILFLHGGGFTLGGGMAAAYAALSLASRARSRIYALDYRMPPDHPYPAAVDDAVEAYCWLLERYEPQNLALYGPSAGGNLAAACLLRARDLGAPLPAACALHSPAADATEAGDTYQTNATIDVVLRRRSPELYALYADGHDLKDPLISPLFGDFSRGFPPTILTSGTRDLLLSSTVLLHRALRRAGIEAELHVWEAMTHGGFFGIAPEDEELLAEQIRFMFAHMTLL